jgi:rSAM/selenodomain-associated transferase 1
MTHTALIIFAKLPRVGEVKTRLGESIGMERAVEVYKQFAEHAFSLADELHSLGVLVYIFYAPGATKNDVKNWVGRPFHFAQQHGESLGERMKNAFNKTFADGAMRTVIIGTDVPELDAIAIRSAYEMLSTHDVVIGPSTDGGYYLLGMNAPTKNVFGGITWSVETVLQQTLTKVQSLQLSHLLLPTFSDIDTDDDFREYLSRTKKLPR